MQKAFKYAANSINAVNIVATTAKTVKITGTAKDLDYFQAVSNANGRTIINNTAADNLFKTGSHEKYDNPSDPFQLVMTGTVVVYTAPNRPFEALVKNNNLVFEIPERYRENPNIALVLTHPNFTIEKQDNGLYVLKGKITNVVYDFPAENGWYLTEDKTGIPMWQQVPETSQHARQLMRSIYASVSPVFRGRSGPYCENRWRNVYLNHPLNLGREKLTFEFGVAYAGRETKNDGETAEVKTILRPVQPVGSVADAPVVAELAGGSLAQVSMEARRQN